jgi:hypothetical protein
MSVININKPFPKDQNGVPFSAFTSVKKNYKLTGTQITVATPYQLENYTCKSITIQNISNGYVFVGFSSAKVADGIRLGIEGITTISIKNSNELFLYTGASSIDVRIAVGD